MSPDHFGPEGGYGRGAESIEELRPEVVAKYLEPLVAQEYPRFVSVNGLRLWRSSIDCPHENNNACAFCDFDGYYATKYGPVCPWKEADD